MGNPKFRDLIFDAGQDLRRMLANDFTLSSFFVSRPNETHKFRFGVDEIIVMRSQNVMLCEVGTKAKVKAQICNPDTGVDSYFLENQDGEDVTIDKVDLEQSYSHRPKVPFTISPANYKPNGS